MNYPRILGSQILAMGSAVVSRASIYVILILASQFLSPYDFGVFAVLIAVTSALNALITGGGDMWLNRFIRRRAVRAGRGPYLARMYLQMCAGLAVIVLVVAGGIAAAGEDIFRGNGYVIALGLAGASWAGLSEALLAVLRVSGRVRLFFVMRDLIAPMAYVGFVAGYRPESALEIIAVYASLWLVVLLVLGLFLLAHWSVYLPRVRRGVRRFWPVILRHTGAFVFGNVSARLLASIDVLVLTFVIAIATVGEYRLAAQFAVGFIVVQHFVFLALPWQLRQAGGDARGAGLPQVAIRQRLLLAVAVPALVAIGLLADPLLGLLGERFLGVSGVLIVLLLVRFSELLWGPQHETLVSNGHVVWDALSNMVGLAAWLIAFAIGIAFLPPIAAALAASALGATISQAARLYVLRRVGLDCPFGHPFGLAAPLIVTALAVAGSLIYVQ